MSKQSFYYKVYDEALTFSFSENKLLGSEGQIVEYNDKGTILKLQIIYVDMLYKYVACVGNYYNDIPLFEDEFNDFRDKAISNHQRGQGY